MTAKKMKKKEPAMTLHLDNLPRTIYVERKEGKPRVVMIDQRALPGELTWIRTADWRVVVDAVKTLAVRGAPAIGVAGAAAVMLAAFELAGSRDGAAAIAGGGGAAAGAGARRISAPLGEPPSWPQRMAGVSGGLWRLWPLR